MRPLPKSKPLVPCGENFGLVVLTVRAPYPRITGAKGNAVKYSSSLNPGAIVKKIMG